MQVSLSVKAVLLSDAIFGSGYSIPGGEKIAVCQDANGYPYLKGSTLKGLLRESMERLLHWKKQDLSVVALIFGKAGWEHDLGDRRIRLTSLTLENPPATPEDCFDLRTFTAMENGVVKPKTLRTASCIRRGLTFSGRILCEEADAPLIQEALSGIKWVGTLRSRGFGRVEFTSHTSKYSDCGFSRNISPCGCLRYRFRSELPILITDLSQSSDNTLETRSYIPGSAIRGMVLGALADKRPDFFREHRIALFSDATRFLPAVPVIGKRPPVPSPQGFCEDRMETRLESSLTDGTYKPGQKRAKLGHYCALDGSTLRFWSTKTEGSTRIERGSSEKDTMMFSSRSICAGQLFEGYILLDNETLAPEIADMFTETIWLGADRFEGFGQCSVQSVAPAELPDHIQAYGYTSQEQITNTLYLLAVSPFTMVDAIGEPCGIDEEILKEKLNVRSVSLRQCCTAMAEYGAYNRTWACRAPAVQMYREGSVFVLECSEAPALEDLLRLQRQGIGIHRSEGYGQILFLRPDLYHAITKKERLEEDRTVSGHDFSKQRYAKYTWIMDQKPIIERFRLSHSQIGSVQAQIEKSLLHGSSVTELKNYLQRAAERERKFEQLSEYIDSVLNGNVLPDQENFNGTQNKLELLRDLLDYSRKGR